jgi:membrane protein implicated in regulation of membrane protease activity
LSPRSSKSGVVAKALAGLLTFLRFLNLLEPGKNILSITKAAMWVCVGGLAASLFLGFPVDITTLSAFFSVSALYAWRRFVQWKTGTILGETPDEPPGPAG